ALARPAPAAPTPISGTVAVASRQACGEGCRYNTVPRTAGRQPGELRRHAIDRRERVGVCPELTRSRDGLTIASAHLRTGRLVCPGISRAAISRRAPAISCARA